MNYKNLEEEAYQLAITFGKLTPRLLMRKFKLCYEGAKKLRDKVHLRHHLEARQMAKEMESL